MVQIIMYSTGAGFTGSSSDPNIYLVRGQKYKFSPIVWVQSIPNPNNCEWFIWYSI